MLQVQAAAAEEKRNQAIKQRLEAAATLPSRDQAISEIAAQLTSSLHAAMPLSNSPAPINQSTNQPNDAPMITVLQEVVQESVVTKSSPVIVESEAVAAAQPSSMPEAMQKASSPTQAAVETVVPAPTAPESEATRPTINLSTTAESTSTSPTSTVLTNNSS